MTPLTEDMTPETTTLAERIKKLKETKGWNNSTVADHAKTSRTAVTCWMNGSVKTLSADVALNLSRASGFSLAWLATGEGEPMDAVSAGGAGQQEVQKKNSTVPVITFESAVKLPEPAGASELLGKDFLTTTLILSDKAFALQMNDSSMSPLFGPGDLVLIDPEISPMPGDFAAAVCEGKTCVLRQYRLQPVNENGAAEYELLPLNKMWPEIRSDRTALKILGTVMEHRRFRRV